VPIPGISDHEAVYGELHLAVKIQVPTRRTVYMWHKAEIRQHISNFSTSFLYTFSTFSDVGLLWERFRDVLIVLNNDPLKTRYD